MEVHYHPVPPKEGERKRFKEYFLEFLMIFLGVAMGFIAENIRKNISENKIAARLAESLYKEVYSDCIIVHNDIGSMLGKKDAKIHQFKPQILNISSFNRQGAINITTAFLMMNRSTCHYSCRGYANVNHRPL